MREVLDELTAALDRRLPCVYCAVVETRGSTPQKAGAAMLVFPDGGQRGTLGGGCVEAEVKGRALAVLASGEARETVAWSVPLGLLVRQLQIHEAILLESVGHGQADSC